MSSSDPVNVVRIAEQSLEAVVDDCVICGGTHSHGPKDPSLARGEKSHRSRHCGSAVVDWDDPMGYYLTLPEDYEPPEWWDKWASEEVDGYE